MSFQDIQPNDLKSRLGTPTQPVLLDVRQPEEVKAASIEGALCIPMNDVPWRMDELDKNAEIVVFCHRGGRSAQVAQLLSMRGFTNVKNLAGGIDAWSVTVDPSVPRYLFDGRSVQVMPTSR